MQGKAQEIHTFFYSQAFADGFRTTFAILLPALSGFYFGFFETGLTISLGAMATSFTDSPGPIIHKRNGMLFCIFFIFIVALITPFALFNEFTTGILIAVITFFFSMFTVYGNRAGAVGNAAILVMILTMDRSLQAPQVLPYALLVAAGGVFYTITSLLLYFIRPYKNAQRALGDCIGEIATYLGMRAEFYNTESSLDKDYNKVIAQQIIVNERLDVVRELFFKTRQIVQESTEEGRKLVFTFVETVDLFENITAAYYDYDSLRNQFGHTGALDLIYRSLKKIEQELNSIAFSMQSGFSFSRSFDYDEEVKNLKAQIDTTFQNQSHSLVLKKIVVNIRNLLNDLTNIQQYFERDTKLKKTNVDHSHFVSHQSLNANIFWNNFSLQSSVFRHSIRVSSACTVGYLLARLLSYGQYNYWILLTIAFILKPAFSLTKQRNIERMIGTVAGGAIGVLILVFIPGKNVHFIFMVLFMIGSYSFMRINYLVMVICITPYVLILFSFLGAGFQDVVEERILDTLIGGAIAFLASYLLFPQWESGQVKNYMQGILKANAAYMKKIVDALSGQKLSMLEYKLARKEVNLQSANLSAAFQRMLSEPKSKQSSQKQLHQFVVLNHILFSNMATIATTLLSKEATVYPAELLQLGKKAYSKLKESSRKFEAGSTTLKIAEPSTNEERLLTADELLMKEQLQFIVTVSNDIDKITKVMAG
ncbi:MAG TPA: FUSC family membrane protein [Flavisolibacter sp.]|nr:FUSC family membrane protein [Flavisolibacter sp.]